MTEKMTKANKKAFIDAVEALNASGVQRGYGRPLARARLMAMEAKFGKPALDDVYRKHYKEDPPR